MLPRLRFIFVAALIAALPWLVLGSGIVTTAQNTPVSEQARPSQGVTIAAGDLRDTRRMHALAFVRRSRELERLRDMASAPLTDWIAAPSGSTMSSDIPAEPDEAASPDEPNATPPTVVAGLPPEPSAAPVTAGEAPSAAMPEPVEERMAAVAPAKVGPEADIEPALPRMDWSTVIPPLPKARVSEENRKSAVRRKRHRHVVRIIPPPPNPFGFQPDPFAGPPATATINNQATSGVPGAPH